MYNSIRKAYAKVVDLHEKSNTKPSRSVILSDRKFNEWLENPTMTGDEFAKHNRAFIKFCVSYVPDFEDSIRVVNHIADDVIRKVDSIINEIGIEEYRYHPSELLDNNDFVSKLDYLISSNAPFSFSTSSRKECNGLSISRAYPYGEIDIDVFNEIDEIPELFDDAVWEIYHRCATKKEMDAITHEYKDGDWDYIPSTYASSQSVIGKTAKEILTMSCLLFENSKSETDKQYKTAQEIVKAVIGNK